MICAAAFFSAGAAAQELTPRAYWPLPVGTDVLVLAYQNSSGDVVLDASLPLTGVDSEIDFFQVAYQRTFGLFGRTTSAQISLPYADGNTQGLVEGEFRQRKTSGVGDARVRLAINLKGAPAMDAQAFQKLRQDPHPVFGASLTVQAPTGEYDSDRLINLGTNRWAFKPALGVIIPMRPTWLFEVEAGAWLFTDNDDYLGRTLEQDPIGFVEAHLVKQTRRGFWVSLDANYYTGGETRVEDGPQQNLQRNTRVGVTAVVPLNRHHALRASYSTGVETRSGGEFDAFSLSYLYTW